MSVKTIIQNKRLGGYLGVLGLLLGLAAAVVYCMFSVRADVFSVSVLLCILAGMICEGAAFLKDIGILPVTAEVLYESAFMLFISTNLASFVDYFNGIKMFGGTEDMGSVFTIMGLLLAAVLVEIVSCFMKRTNTVN